VELWWLWLSWTYHAKPWLAVSHGATGS
jgi:hypothetical protein